MYKLIYFVPQSHLEVTKEALFAVEAGTLGNYAKCAWQVLGEGQFMPLLGSQPYVGDTNNVHKLAEWRVEILLSAQQLKPAIDALKQSHPYQTPAFEVVALVNIDTL